MTRVIITGATGTIGTALIRELISSGVEILVLTRKESKRNARIMKHPLISVKYCALEELCEIQNDTGKIYDVFYHFAWAAPIGPGRNDMYLQNQNVKSALDAVGAAHRFGCRMFIGAGSQAEYGRAEDRLRPDTPAFPEMGYGYAKLCAGQMTREYAHQLGMQHIWVRILSVYGPNDGSQSMVMSTINKLRAGEVPELTKGEQLWDYLYSRDAAQAFILLGEKGHDGKVYVLGSGNARPLAEYVNIIRDVVAPKQDISLGAIPYGEKQVMYLCADIEDLTRDTGFEPQYSFYEGIVETVKWVKEVMTYEKN